ncbi:unnamed protein product [Prunus armeniaca]
MFVFLGHLGDAGAEELYLWLEIDICRRFSLGGTHAGGMVLSIVTILGRHSRVWGVEEATGLDGRRSQLNWEVKVGGLYKVSMWDFVQIAVVVTRVLKIRFGSLGSSAVESFSRCLAPRKSIFLRQGRRRVCLCASHFEAGYAWLITV